MRKGKAPTRNGGKEKHDGGKSAAPKSEPTPISAGGSKTSNWARIPDWIKAAVALAGALLAAGNYLLSCDRKALTLVVGIVSYLGLLVFLLWLAFSKKPILRMGPRKRRRAAIAGVWILVLLDAAGAIAITKRNHDVCNKVAVLVTKFDERDPSTYRVNDKIIDQLRRTLGEFDDTVLLTTSDVVTTIEGPTRARLLGECHCAKFVFWGYCGVTPGGIEVTIHVEDRTRSRALPLLSTEAIVDTGSVADLNSFQFQARFSEKLSAFVTFLSGFIRYEAEDYDGAVKHFTSANFGWNEEWIAKAHLFFYLANAHFFQGNMEQARADYLQAIDGYSKQEGEKHQLAMAHYNLGVVNMNSGYPQVAKDNYSKAIEIDDSLAEAHNNLGYLLNADGEYAEALASYSKAIGLNDQYPQAYNNRAVVLTTLNRDTEDIEQAVRDCTRSLDISPGYAEAFYNRGNAYATLGDRQKSDRNDSEAAKEYLKAIADYSEAMRLNENYAEAYNNRGDTLNNLKRFAEAIADCSRALEIRPQYAEAYLTRSDARTGLDQLEEAKTDLRRAREICKNLRVCEEADRKLRAAEGKTR